MALIVDQELTVEVPGVVVPELFVGEPFGAGGVVEELPVAVDPALTVDMSEPTVGIIPIRGVTAPPSKSGVLPEVGVFPVVPVVPVGPGFPVPMEDTVTEDGH